jgi:hypothetical protein
VGVLTLRTILLASTLAILAAGCFSKPKPECAFLCGEGGACPDDYRCAPDGWCKLDSVADTFDCGELPADASPPPDEAPTPDAGLDGGGDGGGGLALGAVCTDGTECASTFCSNNRCCDTACAGDCDVCRKSLGATEDGTCTPRASTFVCRAAADSCDVAENCTGTTADCPADDVVPQGASGSPDCGNYVCDGINASCPTTCDGNEDCDTTFTCTIATSVCE